MPPAPKKDCTVILFDVNTKNKRSACQTLMKIVCNNFFIQNNNLMKLILLNCSTTKNRLSDKHGGYEHICEVLNDVIPFCPRTVLTLIEEHEEVAEANWLEGLTVAVKSLSEDFDCIGGIVTLQLIFITDLTTPVKTPDDKTLSKIASDINNKGIYLYVVGPTIEPPFTIKSSEDVKLWMENLIVDETETNLKLMKEVIRRVNYGVICDYQVGVHLVRAYKRWPGTQPWNVPLALGTKIQVPAQTMKFLYEGVECKLSASKSGSKKYIWIDAEDESVEIEPENVTNGIKRHDKFIQTPDNKMFQVQTPRSFTILCFTESCNVPEFWFRQEYCYHVLPQGGNTEAFSVLVDCLAKQNKYIIARRVYNANNLPRIVVLIPKPDHHPKAFLLAQLPFADDVLHDYKEKKLSTAPRLEMNEEVGKFLDSIDVDNEECAKVIPLSTNMMFDANSARIINKAADKFLDKHLSLNECDLDYWQSMTNGRSEDLEKIWPERELLEAKKEEKDSDAESDDFDW